MSPEFTTAVHHLLGQIPPGKVCSYGQLASLAGYPGYARHVGRLLAQLPEDSTLPWFRVVTAGLVPSRAGTKVAARQRSLLKTEGVKFREKRVTKDHLWVP